MSEMRDEALREAFQSLGESAAGRCSAEDLERIWMAVSGELPASQRRALVERMHEQGRGVGVWTVNDDADLRRAVKLGLDMIITDRPVEAIRIVEELSPTVMTAS